MSSRGVVVDFDLLEIKSQMQSKPIPQEVTARENFIETRLKRRRERRAAMIASDVTQQKSTVVKPDPLPKPVKEKNVSEPEIKKPSIRKIKRKNIGE